MKIIGVYTKDFSLYYDIIRNLKNRNIPFVSLSSLKDIPTKVGVVLTSNKELHETDSPKVIAADAYDTIDHAIDLALQMIVGKDLYSKLFIGIDPGEYPGIAVIGDNVILKKVSAEGPEEVKKIVRSILKEYPAIQTVIRIGHGSTTVRNRIINSLLSLNVPIEIVDETKTTPSKKLPRADRDSESAALIALLKGGKVKGRLPLKPKDGEIKNIQERSRKLSGGIFSISREKAIEVLEGKLSLEEAVEAEKRRKQIID